MNYPTKTFNRKDAIKFLTKYDFTVDDRKTTIVVKHKERKDFPEKTLHADGRDFFLASEIQELLSLWGAPK